MQNTFKVTNHMFEEVRYVPTPNCDERPNKTDISLLVIHCISLPPEQFGGPEIEDFFLNRLDYNLHPYFEQLRKMKVSSHLLIRRTGEVIQFVPFHKRAWHAGESEFEGRTQCNDFSIGIELEGTETIPYTSEQYNQLVFCTKRLFQAYPSLNANRITGHSHIAPSRKTDPGPSFEWQRYLSAI